MAEFRGSVTGLYYFICIFAILRDGLIIGVIINEEGLALVVDALFDGAYGYLANDSAYWRGHYLVTCCDSDIECAAIIVESIISHHGRLVSLGQVADHGSYRRRHNRITSGRRHIVATVVIVIILAANGEPESVGCQRGEEKSYRVPAGAPISRAIRMIVVGMEAMIGADMVYIFVYGHIPVDVDVLMHVDIFVYVDVLADVDVGIAIIEIMVTDITGASIDRHVLANDGSRSGPAFHGAGGRSGHPGCRG